MPPFKANSFLQATKMETPIALASAGKEYKCTKRVGRGVPEVTETYGKKCICRRDKALVFCRSCGYYCHGRIRLKCAKHPRVTFLLDLTECPRCHTSVYLDEQLEK